MSLGQRSLQALLWSAVQSWGSRLVGLLFFVTLARLLGPQEFGLLALAMVFVSLLQVFTDQGLALAIVQRDELEPLHIDTAFWSSVASAAFLCLACIALAGPAARFYDQPLLQPVLASLSLVLIIRSLSAVQLALLKRELLFRPLAYRTLCGQLAGGLVGVAMALAGFGVWSLVGQGIAAGLVELCLLWSIAKWYPRWRFSMRHFRELFSFGVNIIGIRLLEFVNRHSDNLLIGSFLGAAALGFYSLAYRLFFTLLDLISGVIGQVSFPAFARLQGDPARLREVFYSVTTSTSLVTFPVFTLLLVTAPTLVPLALGEKWSASVAVIQALCLVGYIESIYRYNADVMLAMGRADWRLRLNLLSAVLNVLFFLVAVRHGIVAVALAYVFRAYLVAPIPLWLVRRLVDIDYGRYLKNLGAPLAGSAAMLLAVHVCRLFELSGSAVVNVAIELTVATICYALMILLLAPNEVGKLRRLAYRMRTAT